jgi:hypothetical protein
MAASFAFSSEQQSNQTRVLQIVNNLAEPLELLQPECGEAEVMDAADLDRLDELPRVEASTNRQFVAELRTVRAGREFALKVTAVPPFRASFTQAPIRIRTSSPRVPLLVVDALATVQPPVVAAPNPLTVAPGPLAVAEQARLLVRNFGTNALKLRNPRVTGVEAEPRIEELEPGRLFSVTVDFSAGFQLPLGRQVELCVDSSYPGVGIIKVPIVHAAAPAARNER